LQLQVILCLLPENFLLSWVQTSAFNQGFGCVRRQQGKSYLGIIDDVQGSKLTVLDIPFTDIDNIVIFKIVSMFLLLWSKSILEMHYQSYCTIMPMQTSGIDCLYVEGASAVHPSSVAKVLPSSPYYSP